MPAFSTPCISLNLHQPQWLVTDNIKHLGSRTLMFRKGREGRKEDRMIIFINCNVIELDRKNATKRSCVDDVVSMKKASVVDGGKLKGFGLICHVFGCALVVPRSATSSTPMHGGQAVAVGGKGRRVPAGGISWIARG